MPITSVTSEALQLKLRQLLPSQQGFGTDLSASDTIIPIIDLTASAEGSDVRQDLQTAIAFGSQTFFTAINNTQTLANTAGFWRLTATSSLLTKSSGTTTTTLTMDDGATTDTVWQHSMAASSDVVFGTLNIDYVFYVATGVTLKAVSNSTEAFIRGSYRQIADNSGTLVQPVGFTPQ